MHNAIIALSSLRLFTRDLRLTATEREQFDMLLNNVGANIEKDISDARKAAQVAQETAKQDKPKTACPQDES